MIVIRISTVQGCYFSIRKTERLKGSTENKLLTYNIEVSLQKFGVTLQLVNVAKFRPRAWKSLFVMKI